MCKGYKEYINQDVVFKKGSSMEVTFTSANIKEHNIVDQDDVFQDIFNGFTDRGKMIVQLYFFDRLTPVDIARQLYCSDQYVYQIIKQCKIYLQAMIGKKPKQKGKKNVIKKKAAKRKSNSGKDSKRCSPAKKQTRLSA